ncbi:hypothetical protein Tco_0626890 [Tanacetum coccineum]|uniref:Uncharacterized protein n=1 Tax=Tanacetum coccineum TaxID=301880 RepID=A0ABQ4WL55_9ASTR
MSWSPSRRVKDEQWKMGFCAWAGNEFYTPLAATMAAAGSNSGSEPRCENPLFRQWGLPTVPCLDSNEIVSLVMEYDSFTTEYMPFSVYPLIAYFVLVNANALNRSIGFDNPVWGLNQWLFAVDGLDGTERGCQGRCLGEIIVMGKPLSPDRVFDFPMDEPHHAYDYFAPAPLPGYAGNPNNNNR